MEKEDVIKKIQQVRDKMAKQKPKLSPEQIADELNNMPMATFPDLENIKLLAQQKTETR